ncbi:hypothetical protein DV113_000388 [Geotrichum candidum]|nr:hypothetical protein DV452_002413 [Geotrichum candidum]KAF7501657.1 hypothetical protein DV113_000388 [Geotrichum candidum]KAI9214273.1 hypothetical protein DS838_000793 [Geotrichum bryndzae]
MASLPVLEQGIPRQALIQPQAGVVQPPQQQQLQQDDPFQKLHNETADCWFEVGRLAESMDDFDKAVFAFNASLRYNPYNIATLKAIANLYRSKEKFAKAVEFYKSILNLNQNSGDIWGCLDELPSAYSAYQEALVRLSDPKDPKLWYGIGILYERSESFQYAEEAFTQVMEMDPRFEKANEIYFRLGIIYKQQQKYQLSLDCFRYILNTPPQPLTEIDIWFQIGHVHEQQKQYPEAKEAYERVLAQNPNHSKVLQQLGWLCHLPGTGFTNQDAAIEYLTKSLETDPADAQSWYLLGRCYMAQQKYNKAYEAYQQAVYRDGQNPTFWCSIGVLYYQINQFRDALDAYFRAIQLNPNISEVWYDLGTLYESCNNQVQDALEAYQRAAELDPQNPHILARLEHLRSGGTSNGGVAPVPGGIGGPGALQRGAPPRPQDVNPHSYHHQQPGPPTNPVWDYQAAQQQQRQQPPAPLHVQQQQQGPAQAPGQQPPPHGQGVALALPQPGPGPQQQPIQAAPQQPQQLPSAVMAPMGQPTATATATLPVLSVAAVPAAPETKPVVAESKPAAPAVATATTKADSATSKNANSNASATKTSTNGNGKAHSSGQKRGAEADPPGPPAAKKAAAAAGEKDGATPDPATAATDSTGSVEKPQRKVAEDSDYDEE